MNKMFIWLPINTYGERKFELYKFVWIFFGKPTILCLYIWAFLPEVSAFRQWVSYFFRDFMNECHPACSSNKPIFPPFFHPPERRPNIYISQTCPFSIFTLNQKLSFVFLWPIKQLRTSFSPYRKPNRRRISGFGIHFKHKPHTWIPTTLQSPRHALTSPPPPRARRKNQYNKYSDGVRVGGKKCGGNWFIQATSRIKVVHEIAKKTKKLRMAYPVCGKLINHSLTPP